MAVPVATRHSFLLYQKVPCSAGDVDTQKKNEHGKFGMTRSQRGCNEIVKHVAWLRL